MKKYKDNKQEQFNVGRRIRAEEVLCIEGGNNYGVISLQSALDIARSSGLDLVQVSSRGNVPVCKVLDFSKFKYDQSKKEKESKKKQRTNNSKTKEIKFRPATGENDLRIKAKQVQDFINEGYKVKISIVFKGRELSYKSIGEEKFDIFVSMLVNFMVESSPVLIGKQMTAVLVKQLPEKKVLSNDLNG